MSFVQYMCPLRNLEFYLCIKLALYLRFPLYIIVNTNLGQQMKSPILVVLTQKIFFKCGSDKKIKRGNHLKLFCHI